MRSWMFVAMTLAICLSAIVVSGCDSHHRGSLPQPQPKSTPELAQLVGLWRGSNLDEEGYIGKCDWALDTTGNVMQSWYLENDFGLTAVISKDEYGDYTYIDDYGISGVLFVDDGARHMCFVDEVGWFGVVEKGAPEDRNYTDSSAVGTWAGIGFRYDPNWNKISEWNQTLTVKADLTFSGSADTGVTFDGNVTTKATLYGGWSGPYTSLGGRSGDLIMVCSPDETVLWCYATPSWIFPEDFEFYLLVRQ